MEHHTLDLQETFACLEGAACFALAVSGGGDSMALMHMIGAWRETVKSDTVVIVVTVDHGLRDDSSCEAEFVCGEAARLGFEAHSLKLENFDAGARLQERARDERYKRMTAFLKARGVDILVTAHTLDDQAETFLMRLARGSGVDGLSAMSERRSQHGIEIVRPLLTLSRGALRHWLTARGGRFVEDPSNEDDEFERVRVRGLLEELTGEFAEIKENIGRSAKRLARARLALEQQVSAFIHTDALATRCGVIEVQRQAFFDLPEELQLRVLARVIELAGGGARLRYSGLEKALWHIGSMGAAKYAFGGTLIDGRDDVYLLIYREAKQVNEAPLIVEPGQTLTWDYRLKVTLDGAATGAMTLGVLSMAELSEIKRVFREKLNRRFPIGDEIAMTLLAGRIEGQLVALPQVEASDAVPMFEALGVPVQHVEQLHVAFPVASI